MAIPHADKLITRARAGERLTAKERRHCVAFIMVTQPETTNVESAELFGVSESLIRADKKVIREERAKLIKEDDIGLVIADIALSFEQQVRDIERSKNKCALGSRSYLEHCKAIFKIQLDKVTALQTLGYYPKNLGNMSVERFEYLAVVSKDGSVDTRPVDLIVDTKTRDDCEDAEFEDVQTLALSPPSSTSPSEDP